MRKIYFKIILCLFLFSLLFSNASIAQEETRSSPNYLVVLVTGINSTQYIFNGNGEKGSDLSNFPSYINKYPFGDLKGYLENDLGLKGYVYAYCFSERDGRVSLQGRELGDSNYDNQAATKGGKLYHIMGDNKELMPEHTGIKKDTSGQGNSWLEQAREDFIKWFTSKNKRSPAPKEIPDKYILICHSMGGISARSYISSSYYNNDVAALITIDSQHLGADGALALKRVYEFYRNNKDVESIGQLVGISFTALLTRRLTGIDQLKWVALYSGMCAPIMSAGRDIADALLAEGFLGWYPSQPGVQDMDPESTFFNSLNSKNFIKGNSPLKVRFIYGDGIPTPSGDLPANRYVIGLETIETVLSSPYISKLPLGSKLTAVYMSIILGAIVNQSGDIYAKSASQQGEGLGILNSNNIDFEKYGYTFGDDSDILKDIIMGALVGMAAVDSISFMLDPFTESAAKLGIILSSGAGAYSIFQNRLNNFLMGHGIMLKKSYEEHLIDNALDDISLVGGKSTTMESKSGIKSASLSQPTASFNDYDQAFALLSNLNADGTLSDTYRTITPEAFTEGTPDPSKSWPIEIDGKKKWVTSVTVKAPPTAVKGVINTYLPLKLKEFKYSENFAAWKDVPNIDRWGNFTLKDLKLAEGQNVIAFKATSFADNKMNQHLKIIVNTIPQVISSMFPLPNSYTNNNKTTISGEFNKSVYSTNTKIGEGIPTLTSAELYRNGKPFKNLLNDPDFKIEHIKVNDYHTKVKFTYTPSIALEDGAYEIVVKAKSEVGSSQGAWGFWVDTTPPDIKMPTLEASSTNKSMNIKYVVSDNISPFLKNITCGLFDSKDNLIALIGTAESVSPGDHFFPWNGKTKKGKTIPDGSYYISIKASDQAGNKKTANVGLVMDSSPPLIKKAAFTPETMTSLHSQQTAKIEVNEAASVFIKMKNVDTGTTNVYLAKTATASPTTNNLQLTTATYTWNYDNQFSAGLKDGLYDVKITAQDTAGNESTPYKYGTIRVDRTAPVIYAQAAVPYVLANTGTTPYTTTFSYQLSEDASDVTVKILNESTGELIKTFSNASTSITWNAGGSIPAGAYQFKIIAEDKYGNYSTAYASCVKDGIAPVISFPANNDTVSGTVAIKGTATDPDWTNDKPFESYSLFYSEGSGGDWKTDFIEIPAMNGGGTRPLQGNSTLGYFYTTGLKNGTYTIKVVAKEKDGLSVSTTRVVNVYNDSEQTVETPYIKLSPVAPSYLI